MRIRSLQKLVEWVQPVAFNLLNYFGRSKDSSAGLKAISHFATSLSQPTSHLPLLRYHGMNRGPLP